MPLLSEAQRLSFVAPSDLMQSELTEDDRMAVIVWFQHVEIGTAEREMVLRLSVIRQHMTRGFLWLVRHHNRAADIAVRMKWHIPEPHRTPTDEEAQAVSAVVASLGGKMQADPLFQAPRSYEQRFEAQQERKIGQLPDAVIRAARDADANIRAAREAQARMARERQPPTWD